MKIKTVRPNSHTMHTDIDTARDQYKDWKIEEKPYGLLVHRSPDEHGKARSSLLFPWTSIEWVDYGDDQYVSPTIKSGKR